MTERDPGAERDPDEGGVPREDGTPRGQRREPSLPADEEAAWAAIVAAYGEEPSADLTDLTDPADPKDPTHPKAPTGPGSSADPGADASADTDTEPGPGAEADQGTGSGDEDIRERDDHPEPDGDTLTKPRQAPDEGGSTGEPPVRSFTVYAAGTGPRDWESPADDDEGHFVPPEPPPLPETDTTTKFAWVAVLGGPLLLVAAILFQADLTWWIITLGVGGFLGGFGTLVARMRDGRDEDDWDDPGRGAVV